MKENKVNKTNNILIEEKDSGYIREEIREQDELWCLHCYDTFPANKLKVDFVGNRQGCGSVRHPTCDGAGFGIDIYMADHSFAVACRQSAAERKAEGASMTEKEKREEYIEMNFCESYRRKKHSFLNEFHLDWSSQKVHKHVERYNELIDAQFAVNNIKSNIEGFLNGKRPHNMLLGVLLQEFRNNPPPAWKAKWKNEDEFLNGMLQEKREAEEEGIVELKKLLAEKSYRDSFHFVISELLDKERLEKYKSEGGKEHNTLFALMESVGCAEDAYKISRRSSGCAYAGKRQR